MEVVGTSDYIPNTVQGKCFLEHQGYIIQEILVNQYNHSAMNIENNGQRSRGQKSRNYHIRYFFIKDLIDRKDIEIEYCMTDDMEEDCFTNPQQGKLFRKLKT